MNSKILFYEKESPRFRPIDHFLSRIESMAKKSDYGDQIAKKWKTLLKQLLTDEIYPVVHPIGQETFSLYAEFPTGIFEYALHIDGATKMIEENNIKSKIITPHDIIMAVDEGNINKNPDLINPNHKNPVMVLRSRYLTHNKPYCINGNHRIYEAYRNNDEQIKVFIFNDLEFVPFFYDLLSKATYYLEIDYSNVLLNERHLVSDTENAMVDKIYNSWNS